MEFSVRYIRVYGDSPEKPVLGLRGKKRAIVIVNDEERIHTEELDLKYFDKSAITTFKNEPYPVTRYLDNLVEIAKKKPISPKADHILQLARLNAPEAIDEDALHAFPEEGPVEKPPLDLDRVFGTPEEGEAMYAEHLRRKAAKADPRGKSAGKPASGVSGSPKAAPITPPKRGRGRPAGSAGTGLIARIAKAWSWEQPQIRKACRAAGMRAPYTDEKAIIAAVEKFQKDLAKKEKAKAKGKK